MLEKQMKKLLALVLTGMVFLFACIPAKAPEAQVSAPSPAITGKAPQEDAWEKAVNQARKEGTVVVFTPLGGEITTTLGQAFKEKYGLVVDFSSGRGAEMTQRIITQRKAGLYLVDIYMGGATSGVNTLKPAGVFDPLEQALILPEVVNPRNWLNGELPFVDKDRIIFPYISYAEPALVINTNMVKPEDIKSHRDLLDPRWKGKILMGDPTNPGTPATWFVVVSKSLGLDYMRELIKQDPMITRDVRLMLEWIAVGKYPVGIAASIHTVATFTRAGAPVKHLAIDGTYTTGGPYHIALVNQAPHPNAARVFLNWFLGREAQTLFSKANLVPSARVDVPIDHVTPGTMPRPEYVNANTEEFLLDQPNQMRIAREIFGTLLK